MHPSVGRHISGSAVTYDVDGSQARGKLTSVLEASDLDDFIASAMLSERAFESHKENTVIIGPDGLEMRLEGDGRTTTTSRELPDEQDNGVAFDVEHMSIPRRPEWSAGMTAEDLDAREREAFFRWRRGIAQ